MDIRLSDKHGKNAVETSNLPFGITLAVSTNYEYIVIRSDYDWNNQLAICSTADGSICLYIHMKRDDYCSVVFSVVFSDSSKLLAIGYADGSTEVWDIEAERQILWYTPLDAEISGSVFS